MELNELIRESILNTSNSLLSEYKQKLISLTEEIDIDDIGGISIDPLKLMGGSIDPEINKYIEKKEIEDGDEFIKNNDKAWYKPWTWLQESGYYRTKYKTVSFVNGGALAQEFFSQIEQAMRENGKNACKHAKLQSIKIAEQFKAEFKRLDVVLKNKLAELENYATDKKLAEDRVKESELKLAWLKQINVKVESILEI